MKVDCWLDPYGCVYRVRQFGHEDFAQDVLSGEFPMDGNTPVGFKTWEERGFCMNFQETLAKRGWLRFSTTIDRWSCEHIIDFEKNYPRPTAAQIDKMYEMTGFYYDDPNSYSRFFNF